ncbi:MAG: FAD-dependent oxidoreductase [Chitinophagaceae bacterium]|nr:MAG: FAD-dependent oxidoreductase [Chitinophagaceae bacterium]
MLIKKFVFVLLLSLPVLISGCGDQSDSSTADEVDICIYGGSSAGVIAAYTAAKMNKTVLLIEPGRRLGGLTSGGLGYTDIGNKYAISGLSLDFYRRVGKHYGKLEQWIFEPSVAENIFKEYLAGTNVKVIYEHELQSVEKADGAITSITVSSAGTPKTVKAKIFMDCTYEGDLMAKAGVTYTVGREDNKKYNETYNGVQLMDRHQFPDGIDPYKVKGDKSSGLLWGISDAALDSNGTGDKKVQAYNFRICLTEDSANRIDITKPDNYDPARYELLLRYLEKKVPGDLWGFLKFDRMPNHKTDINNNGPISTDMIGMNYDYPEADYATRRKIQKEHEDYTKGLLYFIGHDERMPKHLREQMLKWGYPKDEYTENGNWTPQMYVREARRMVGQYVMTQANCEGREVATDAVGMAAYTMDSHNCQRLVVNGMVKNEGNVEIGGFGPYPIAYGSIIPKETECTNLFVPICLSASHIAYGSIRMEPVFMVLAQSAAVAAVQAIDAKTSVQKVEVAKVQKILKTDPLADGSVPQILVDNDDSTLVELTGNWTAKPRIGFGRSTLVAEKGVTNASVKFKPSVAKDGDYQVYAYFLPKYAGLSTTVKVVVFDGTKETEVPVNLANLEAQGQTSGEWIDLGKYKLTATGKPSVSITTKDASGVILADAVLFRPQF